VRRCASGEVLRFRAEQHGLRFGSPSQYATTDLMIAVLDEGYRTLAHDTLMKRNAMTYWLAASSEAEYTIPISAGERVHEARVPDREPLSG